MINFNDDIFCRRFFVVVANLECDFDGGNVQQLSQLEIRFNTLLSVNHSVKTIHHMDCCYCLKEQGGDTNLEF